MLQELTTEQSIARQKLAQKLRKQVAEGELELADVKFWRPRLFAHRFAPGSRPADYADDGQ